MSDCRMVNASRDLSQDLRLRTSFPRGSFIFRFLSEEPRVEVRAQWWASPQISSNNLEHFLFLGSAWNFVVDLLLHFDLCLVFFVPEDAGPAMNSCDLRELAHGDVSQKHQLAPGLAGYKEYLPRLTGGTWWNQKRLLIAGASPNVIAQRLWQSQRRLDLLWEIYRNH